jgi:hypothetical protein
MRRSVEPRRTYDYPGQYGRGFAGRPGCVTLYAALAALAGILALLLGAAVAYTGSSLASFVQEKSIPVGQDLVGTAAWIAAGVGLLTAVVNLAIAAGLWRMKNWARLGVVVTNVLGVLSVVCPSVGLFAALSQIFTTSLLAGLPAPLLLIPLAGLALMCGSAYWFATNRELFD